MPKSKKKQRKNEDFTKTKLKVGKRKPSAANSTDISFKSQSINIHSQLEEKDEPTNSRNLSLKDILSQLSHYNQNIRQDASQSLKNFFMQHPATLHVNLSSILSKVLEKSVDAHHIVRKNFLACLKHIFKNVTEQEIQPFFSLVLAHLNCAMTHINDEIQHDSLQFLDLCVHHFPMLFVGDSEKILHSLLNLISYRKPSAAEKPMKGVKRDYKGISSNLNHNLSTNPSSKMSSAESKKHVLESLLQISLVVLKQKVNQEQYDEVTEVSERSVDHARTIIPMNKYGLANQVFKGHNIECNMRSSVDDCYQKAKMLIVSHMPVLFRCWNDCNPSLYSIPSPDANRECSLDTMIIIVDTIKLVVSSFVQTSSIAEAGSTLGCIDFDAFLKSFMYYFPYSDQKIPFIKKSKKRIQEDFNVKDVGQLNLQLCEIFSMLATSEILEENPLLISEKVLNFVKSMISKSGENKLFKYLENIRNILRAFYAKFSASTKYTGEFHPRKFVHEVLQEIFIQYKKTKNFGLKMKLLPFLEEYQNMVENWVSEDAGSMINSWVSILPLDLQQATCDQQRFLKTITNMIKNFVIQKHTTPQTCETLKLAIAHIAASQDVNVLGKSMDEQNAFLELVYYIPKITKDIVQSFASLCHHQHASAHFKQKILNLLLLCYKEKQSIDLANFLSFAFSLILGISKSSLESLQKAKAAVTNATQYGCWKKVIVEDQSDVNGNTNYFEDNHNLVQNVLDILQALDCKCSAFEIFQPIVECVLVNFKILTWKSVLGILLLIESLSNWRQKKKENSLFYKHLSELLLSVFITKNPAGNLVLFRTKCIRVIMNILSSMDDLFDVFMHSMNSVISDDKVDKDIFEGVLLQLRGNEKLMIRTYEYIRQHK